MRTPTFVKLFLLLLLAGLAVTVFVVSRRKASEVDVGPAMPDSAYAPEPGVSGVVRLSVFGDARGAATPQRHVTAFVDGTSYLGQHSNDLRGFLDGTFKYAWNQAGQVHVRVGRRGEAPRYGEYELFRDAFRWDSISLPPGSRVVEARLRLGIEDGPRFPVHVFLYRVRRPWNPGSGGTLENNVSPPKPGEVWWDDAAYGQQPWGLPGASFASNDSTVADTDPLPLAQTAFSPGDTVLQFASRKLAEYVDAQSRGAMPLLLLLKLSDPEEDLPGSVMTVYSGTQGDDRAVSRRPHLTLTWENPGEVASVSKPVELEYGRTYVLPRLSAKGNWVAASFIGDSSSPAATVEMRGGIGDSTSPWRSAILPRHEHWSWVEARIQAVVDPVVLGQAFKASFSNTWIRTDAPERQRVPWVFVSPSGQRHEVTADYQGNYRWEVHLIPDELGRWTYSWTSQFEEEPYRSATGAFDVVLGDRQNAALQLDAFGEQLQKDSLAQRPDLLQRRMVQFMRLERAAMELETPTSFRSPEGTRLRTLLRRVRERLGGQMVPDPIPLVPDLPPEWQRRPGKP